MTKKELIKALEDDNSSLDNEVIFFVGPDYNLEYELARFSQTKIQQSLEFTSNLLSSREQGKWQQKSRTY